MDDMNPIFPELKIVELETFTPCNRTCSYCPNAGNKREKHLLPMHIVEKIAANLADMNFRGQLSFHFYNEPLLDKRLPQIIELMRSYLPGSFFLLYTNGDYLTQAYFSQLAECGINKFLVTKHQQANKKHDLSWSALLPDDKKELLFYQTYQDPAIFYTNRGGLLPHIAETVEPLNEPCFLPSSSMSITAKGNVVICFEDYHETQVMGNVYDSTILEVWHGAAFRKVREQLVTGNRQCTAICSKCNNTENTVFNYNYTHERIK